MSARRGVTLVELIVTLVILAIINGVTVLAIRRIDPPQPSDPRTIFADTLRSVLATGHPTVIRLLTDSGPTSGVVMCSLHRPCVRLDERLGLVPL